MGQKVKERIIKQFPRNTNITTIELQTNKQRPQEAIPLEGKHLQV